MYLTYWKSKLNLKAIILVFSLFVFFPLNHYSQANAFQNKDSTTFQDNSKAKLSFIAGFQIRSNRFFEIGLGLTHHQIQGYHQNTLTYGISHEIKAGRNFIWGTKALMWVGGGTSGLNIGLNVIHYTDFKHNTFKFRPEIGFGIKYIRLTYGYNLSLTNEYFPEIKNHNIGVNLLLF